MISTSPVQVKWTGGSAMS